MAKCPKASTFRIDLAGREGDPLVYYVIGLIDLVFRGVIMVGLPFANAGSAELQEKIKYARQKGEIFSSSADAGKEYYENMCMRGVNQSIGKWYITQRT